jgi:hypothetical protein
VTGVIAVDVDELRRTDGKGGDGLKHPLYAEVPQLGLRGEPEPAELLTVDFDSIGVKGLV